MTPFRPRRTLAALLRVAEFESLHPDLGRAARSTAAIMVPLLLAAAGRLPVEVSFCVITAQSMALLDVRGPYSLRLGFLVATALFLVASTALGTAAAGHWWLALPATALVAVNAGAWRHLTPEYGPSLATPTALVFFMALASHSPPATGAVPQSHAVAVLAGGVWGLVLQVGLWPIRSQHPLRRAVAGTWLAAADCVAALGTTDAPDRLAAAEAAFREAFDRARATLADATAAVAPNPHPAAGRLGPLDTAAARLVTRAGALHAAAADVVFASAGAAKAVRPAYEAAMDTLANVARGVAVAVVSRQPAHLALTEVRLRRAGSLLRALAAAAEASHVRDAGVLAAVVREVEAQLPAVAHALRATIDRAAERGAFSLELLDLDTWRLRPLAAALNLSGRVEPAVVKFAARIAFLTVLGVAVMQAWPAWSHAYWLPFTMVIVLQPDFGATRKRAAQRTGGTLAGAVVGSGLLMLPLPRAAVLAGVAVCGFFFAYFLRRSYGVAVVFITVFVLLLTTTAGHVTVDLAAQRLAATAAGGALALIAALVFWPEWERDRFPPRLAAALRAGRDYLKALADGLAAGGAYDDRVVAAKQRADTANQQTFASLQRLFADPANRREGAEQAAVLANGNAKLTRLLNVVLMYLTPGAPPLASPAVPRFVGCASQALDALAAAVEDPSTPPDHLHAARAALGACGPPAAGPGGADDGDPAKSRERAVFAQLARAGNEVSAILAAARDGRTDEPPAAREPPAPAHAG